MRHIVDAGLLQGTGDLKPNTLPASTEYLICKYVLCVCKGNRVWVANI